MPAKSTYVVGIVLSISIFFVSILTGSENIDSDCVCPSTTPAEALEEADAVLLGKVIDRTEARGGWQCRGPNPIEVFVNGGNYSARLRVSTVWKGSVSETVFVSVGGVCGAYFSPGEMYLVYGHRSKGVFYSSACGVVPVSQVEEHLGILGEGWAPEPGSISPTPKPAPTPPTCPTATPDPTNTRSPSNGTCSILAQSNNVPIDATSLGLVAGVGWLVFRKRRHK